MFSKRLNDLRGTLALRLTLWYAGVFAASSAIAFSMVYFVIVSIVHQRTDEDLEDDIEEFAALLQSGGFERVESEMVMESQEEGASGSYLRLWSTDGRELLATDLSAWQGLSAHPVDVELLKGIEDPILETLTLPQREYSVRRVIGAIAPGLVLELGESLEDDEDLLATFANALLITLVVVLLLGAPIGWFMAHRALKGVKEITRTATEIAGGALERRVTTRARGDELDRLAEAFNTMLDRIQTLIIGMRDVTDNLAHDLRSPLARLRASAEMTLSNGDSGTGREALAANTVEECDRLLDIINTTLDIAEAESGAAQLRLEALDLVELVKDASEVFQTVAEDKDITIEADLPASCRFHGDRQRLQRVVANLLDNAIKYTAAGGHVKILVSDDGRQVRLSIQDNGVGIAADDLSHIFKRFYRCDRSRSEQGNGLGLSLALAFIHAHGGDIAATSAPGRGSTFEILLVRGKRSRLQMFGEDSTVIRNLPPSAVPSIGG